MANGETKTSFWRTLFTTPAGLWLLGLLQALWVTLVGYVGANNVGTAVIQTGTEIVTKVENKGQEVKKKIETSETQIQETVTAQVAPTVEEISEQIAAMGPNPEPARGLINLDKLISPEDKKRINQAGLDLSAIRVAVESIAAVMENEPLEPIPAQPTVEGLPPNITRGADGGLEIRPIGKWERGKWTSAPGYDGGEPEQPPSHHEYYVANMTRWLKENPEPAKDSPDYEYWETAWAAAATKYGAPIPPTYAPPEDADPGPQAEGGPPQTPPQDPQPLQPWQPRAR